ncbi:hypothetical protein JTE90_002274 [Oedothorax gibbosus]|uniref:Uncharacterized protein n=1 Tax=Oedothorax gibbosus TaxID=931172 RepID=A0AAV6UEN8_9ARAC|nr:hypothetical protein JTE90_002274 [Oedothorax gibbosus]
MSEIEDDDYAFNLHEASIQNFDSDAALSATAEQSRDMLKVLKHYVRAIHGSDNVNSHLYLLLTVCGMDPRLPYAVVGGFPFILKLLQVHHECSGRDCVIRTRQQLLPKKTKDSKKFLVQPIVERDYKKSVKQPGIRVGKPAKTAKKESKGALSREKKEFPNYFI